MLLATRAFFQALAGAAFTLLFGCYSPEQYEPPRLPKEQQAQITASFENVEGTAVFLTVDGKSLAPVASEVQVSPGIHSFVIAAQSPGRIAGIPADKYWEFGYIEFEKKAGALYHISVVFPNYSMFMKENSSNCVSCISVFDKSNDEFVIECENDLDVRFEKILDTTL